MDNYKDKNKSFSLVLRRMKQRIIPQIGIFDFILAMTIVNIIINSLLVEGISLEGSIITSFTLISLYIIRIKLKSILSFIFRNSRHRQED